MRLLEDRPSGVRFQVSPTKLFSECMNKYIMQSDDSPDSTEARFIQFGPLQNNGDLRMHYKIRRSADYDKKCSVA